MKKGLLVLFLSLVLMISFYGCHIFSDETTDGSKGSMVISTNIPDVLTEDISMQSILEEVALKELIFKVEYGNKTRDKVVEIDALGEEVEVIFDELPLGTWDVKVKAMCEEGYSIAEGIEQGQVMENAITDVHVTLDLVPTQLEFEVIVPDDEKIETGKVTLLGLVEGVDTIENEFSPEPGSSVTLDMGEVMPRIWIVNLEFFDEDEQLLYGGEKQKMFLPGRTTNVQLELDDGNLRVIIDWNLPPERPKNLSLIFEDDSVNLDWDEVDGAIGYLVIRSIEEFDRGKSLTKELIEDTTYSDSYEFDSDKTYWYRVVAYNSQGLSSNYSSSVAAPIPASRNSYSVEDIEFFMRLAPAASFPLKKDDSETGNVENSFWIGETPVTYELWYKVRLWSLDHGYSYNKKGSEGSDRNGEQEGEAPTDRRNEPVTQISWYDPIVWCNALSEKLGFDPVYTKDGEIIRDANSLDNQPVHEVVKVENNNGFRLPSIKEWELAARYIGPDPPQEDPLSTEVINKDDLYWTPGNYASGAVGPAWIEDDEMGDEEATRAAGWYEENTDGTQDVGQKPQDGNKLGLYDISGNVNEWCFDNDSNGNEIYAYLKGGGYTDAASWLRIGHHQTTGLSVSRDNLGFRISRGNF